jgi:hypothetical protein
MLHPSCRRLSTRGGKQTDCEAKTVMLGQPVPSRETSNSGANNRSILEESQLLPTKFQNRGASWSQVGLNRRLQVKM